MATAQQEVEAGSVAPGFRLPSSKGEISLNDYNGKSGVVLYFIREFGCMTCQAHAGALVKLYPELQAGGYDVLIVGGGSVSDAEKMAQRIKAPFPILADKERTLYDLYNVDKSLGFIQKSATFVVDTTGKIIYAHRSTNPAGGFNANELRAALK